MIQGDVGDEIVSRDAISGEYEADGEVEMLRAQVGALKGAPADQVVRVSTCCFGARRS